MKKLLAVMVLGLFLLCCFGCDNNSPKTQQTQSNNTILEREKARTEKMEQARKERVLSDEKLVEQRRNERWDAQMNEYVEHDRLLKEAMDESAYDEYVKAQKRAIGRLYQERRVKK
jgi:uncharacterized protein YaiL (DUF2058 family)